MRHLNVYGLRRREPSQSLDEALEKLRRSVLERKRDELEERYSSESTEQTRALTNRMVGSD